MKIRDNINKIDLILRKASKVFVIGHINSDLDAIGSCLGLAEYLKDEEIYIIYITIGNELLCFRSTNPHSERHHYQGGNQNRHYRKTRKNSWAKARRRVR